MWAKRILITLAVLLGCGLQTAPPAAPRAAVAAAPSPSTAIFPAAPRGAPASTLATRPWPALALTPPMGWNGYAYLSHAVTAGVVEAQAEALVRSGMAAEGYRYVNLDGGWDLSRRSAAGELVADPAKFPQGIAALAAFVHRLGLKFGIYTSAGTANCAGTSAGSFGHYGQDALAFAAWGVDYLKFDYCRIPYARFPSLGRTRVKELLAAEMGSALAATGRSIVFDLNDGAASSPALWAGSGAELWRTAPDIEDTFRCVLRNFRDDVRRRAWTRPGGWGDPDELEVGNGGLTPMEARTQFTLWAEMAAPLIVGTDVADMTATTRSILTNPAVIAVDQDPAGRPAYPVSDAGGHWILVKVLADGGRAVVLFNATSEPATISADLAQLGLRPDTSYALQDLWSGARETMRGSVSAEIPPGGVVMLRLRAVDVPA